MAVGRHRLTCATGTTIDRIPVNSIAAQGGLVGHPPPGASLGACLGSRTEPWAHHKLLPLDFKLT